jgi:RNA polymerase sigma-70 factor (family 1)
LAAIKTLSDSELLDLLKSGSQAAYTEVYDRYQGLLYIYACKITREENEAADIVQEVFIYLWDKRAQTHFRASLASYLYSAVRYKFFNLLDHKKVRADYAASLQEFMNEGYAETDYVVREKDLARLIEKEIALLPTKMREVFELSRKAHLSHKQIAEKLGLSEKTVKNQVNNALKELRVKLGLFSFLIFLIKF